MMKCLEEIHIVEYVIKFRFVELMPIKLIIMISDKTMDVYLFVNVHPSVILCGDVNI